MSDWDDGVPTEQPLTRGQRFRDSIARAVIRPGSAATGEQIFRFQEDEGDSYDKVGFSEAVSRDARSLNRQRTWADETMVRIKNLNAAADKLKEIEDRGPLDRDPDSFERQEERKLDKSRRSSSFYGQHRDVVDSLAESRRLKRAAEAEEKQLLEGYMPSFGYPRATNKHITLAALLGTSTVDRVLEERKRFSNVDKDVKSEKGTVEYDTGHGYTGEYTINSVAIGKALHRRKTRNLSRYERLKERIFPYRVGVYEEHDAYGGSQEGGWWYNEGELVHESRPFMTKRGALKEGMRLEQQYPENKRGLLNLRAADAYQADLDEGVFEPLEYTDNFAEAVGMPSKFIQTPEDEDYNYSHFGQPSNDYRVYVTRGKPSKMYPEQKPYYS